MTSGRARSECAATYVSAIASRPHTRTGPPFERLYAVEPEGVAQMIPSHGCRPSSSPPTASSSSIMRPSEALATTTSLTACRVPSGCSTSSVGSSTTSYSPANTRASPVSRSCLGIELRKPTRPKLTPITGTPVPRNRVSARRHGPVAPEHDGDVRGRSLVVRLMEELDPMLVGDGLQACEPGSDLARLPVRDDRRPRDGPSRAPTASAIQRSMSSWFASVDRFRRWTKNSRFPFGPGSPESTTPTVSSTPRACRFGHSL